VELVRRGLPFRMLDEVAAAAGVGRLALAEVIGLSRTTLSRRRDADALKPAESDRLVRLARLVAMAHELMRGDGAAARRWLQEPNELIEGESPLERASTEVGGREVEELIGRLRHGVFS
jgi:putative toxin-antitoxin system antitoxin component (TIGR02293 family)